MKLESTALVIDFNPYQTRTEADATHSLGSTIYLADGRVFKYAKVGASNISVGKLQTAPAPITNHHNMAATATAIGATSINVTPAATGGNADIYAEGYAIINAGTGAGQVFKVSGHAAITSSVAFDVKTFDPISTALTTSSKVTLIHNDYNGVIEGTSSTVRPAGVPLISLLAGDYGWLQTKGVASVLADETLTLGAQLTPGTSTTGAVEEYDDDSTPLTDSHVGWAIVAGVDGEYRPVFLEID